jgi:tetratricopeptide (TPR) repeat protein
VFDSTVGRDDLGPEEARKRFAAELTRLILKAESRWGRSLNRPELAKRLNISTGSLYAYLNGTTLPRSRILDHLIDEIGITGPEAGRLGTLRDAAEVAQRTRRGRTTTETTLVRLLPPQQLPPTTGQFVGRSMELSLLDELLGGAAEHPQPTIIVIDGTAGIGKTTLALYWSHRIRNRYPDGQLHVNLRGFDPGSPVDPEQALHGFLHALGVAATAIPADVDTKAALYRTLLAERRMLVVLDNARSSEHVRPLLPGTPTCTVVITSRDRLDSLIVREGAHRLSLDVLPHDDALALLARQITPARLAAEAAASDEIVRLCACLPLALSIVAARAANRARQPLTSLVDELRDMHGRLDVLGSPAADLDLRTVFQWSYTILPEPAARLFRLLGAHPGPDVDSYGCAALLGMTSQPRVLLDLLVASHIITEQRPGRFGFHDLLHAYAREQYDCGGPAERRAALDRLLDYYLNTAILANQHIQPCRTDELTRVEMVWPQPRIDSYAEAMAWFGDELPALQSMIMLAATHGFESHAWQLAWSFNVYLRRTGRRAERAAVHRIALDAALHAGDRTAYATTLRLLADALARLGQTRDSLDFLYTSLAEYHALDDADGMRQVHLSLTRVHEAEGHYVAALKHAEDALRLAHTAGNLLARADGLTAVSKQECLLGRHSRALSLGTQAFELYFQLGHSEGQADVLMNIGLAEHRLGRHDRAIAHYERSLKLDRQLGDRFWEAHALDHLADTHEAKGDHTQAHARRAEALAVLESLHHPDAESIRAKLTDHG